MGALIDWSVQSDTERDYLDSGVAEEQGLAEFAHSQDEKMSRWSEWSELHKLNFHHWKERPSEEDVDGYISPSLDSMESALRYIEAAAINRDEPPTRIVEDGNGGIVLEWDNAPIFQAVHFRKDGSAERRLFEDRKLVSF